MKKVLGLCLCMVLAVVGCYDSGNKSQQEPTIFNGIDTVTFEGCEYLSNTRYGVCVLAHKGNCKNPIHYCKCPVKKGK
jgi:hypothetical protein